VEDESVNCKDFVVLWVGQGRKVMLPMVSQRNLEQYTQVGDIRDTSAGNVPSFPSLGPLAPHKLVVVWVVNSVRLNLHRVPVKGCVAVWAPHLRAPTNLEDHRPALGARLGVLFEEIDSLHIIGVAGMCVIVPNLVAILANVILANLALPPSREKPSAVVDGTLADKLLLLNVLGICWNLAICDASLGVCEIVHMHVERHDLITGLCNLSINLSALDDSRDCVLGPGKEALLALKEDRLPVTLELGVPEHLGAGDVDHLAGPEVLAPHAVGIGRHRQEICLNAYPTRVEITKWAHNLFVI